MIGYKHIPQIITGKQADKILKALPKKSCPQQGKKLSPLPVKFTVNWR